MKNQFYKANIDMFNESSCVISEKEIVSNILDTLIDNVEFYLNSQRLTNLNCSFYIHVYECHFHVGNLNPSYTRDWKKGLKFSRVMSIDGMDIIDVEQLNKALK